MTETKKQKRTWADVMKRAAEHCERLGNNESAKEYRKQAKAAKMRKGK